MDRLFPIASGDAGKLCVGSTNSDATGKHTPRRVKGNLMCGTRIVACNASIKCCTREKHGPGPLSASPGVWLCFQK